LKTRILIGSAVAAMLLSGCAAKYDKDVMEDMDYISKRLVDYKTTHLQELVKEEIKEDDKFIRLEEDKDLDTLLQELSLIDGNQYYLDKGKGFIVNRSGVKIHTFEQLNNYIKATKGKEIKITKNLFVKSLPKVVSLYDNDETKLSMDKIIIKLNEEKTIGELIDYINKATDFKMFIKKSSFLESSTEGAIAPSVSTDKDILLDKNALSTKLTIQDWTLSEFIKYLEKSLNYYVDVDVEQKTITVSRYKMHSFDIKIPNVDTTFDDSGKEVGKATATGGAQVGSDNNKIYDAFKSRVENILIKMGENKKNISIDNVTGTLTVKSTNNTYEEIVQAVNDFNNDISKQLVLRISYFDVILNKDNTLGLDLSRIQTEGVNLKNRFVQNQFLFKTVNDEGFSWFIDSIHKNGYLYNKDQYDILLSNNIPFEDNALINTKYVSSKQTVSNTTDGVSTSTESLETDTYQEGYAVSYLAKIRKNNTAAIKMNIVQKVLENIESETYGANGDTITLPSVKDISKSPLVQLKKGEKIIVWQRRYLDVADNYSGIIPINDFIIGGVKGKAYVQKEYVLFAELVRVKKVN
jgi:hypothetical protein